MSYETFEAMIDEQYAVARRIMVDRQRKYGPHNVTRHGLLGIAVRLADKLARLDRAVIEGRGGDAADESVADTLYDVANYAIIGRCLMNGDWSAAGCPPLAEEAEKVTPLRVVPWNVPEQ